MPVDVQTWRVRVGTYNAGRLSAFRSRYGRPKSIEKMKGSDVAGGCGTVLFGLVIALSLLYNLFRGRLDLSKFIHTIRVRCGGSKRVSSMKMACGTAVLVLFGLAMALCLLLLVAGDVERNPGPNGGNLTMEDLPVLVTKLKEIAGKWHLLGVQLKFSAGTLDGFPPAIQADPIRALQELFTHWLQRMDPPPTLEALSKAVGGPVIGNELLAGTLLEHREDFPSVCGECESTPAVFHGDTSNQAGTGVSDHHDLSSIYSVNSGTASQSGSPGPGAFWCPCGKCSLDSFLSNGCPPQACSSVPEDPLFPFLDTKGLSPEDKEDLEHKLIKETREMILKFGSLVNKTSSSLIKQGVTHQELASCLIHLEGFVADIGQTIIGDHKEEIIRACSVGEVFLILGKYRYWSFLNYEILEHVINELGNSDSKGHLTKYNHDFKDFCQRSAFQVPFQVYSDKKVTRPKFAVKFDETVLNMLENACQAKRKIAEALGVKSSVLFLCCVETGCIKVHFLIPDCIAKKVFPPSSEQLAALHEASVQFLEFDGKQYICQTMAIPVYSRSDSEVDHLVRICQQDNPKDLQQLLLKNRSIATKVSEKTKDGTTALHESCCRGSVECARVLLREEADATILDDRGWAPIHTATYNNHQDVIKLLLNYDACTVDCLSKTNETPLHIACRRGHLDLVKYLIDRGADILKKDNNDSSILHHAASSNNADLVKHLLTISLMKSCLNVKNKFDRTPLHNAATLGCASTLCVLMQSQEELLHVKPTQDKLTPLQLAEALGNTRCQAILRGGADVENPRPHRTGKALSRAHSMPKMHSHRLRVPEQHAHSLPKLDPHKQHLHEQHAHSLRQLDSRNQRLHEQRARSTHSLRTSSASVSPSPTPPLSQEDVHVESGQVSRFSTPSPGNRARPQTKLMSSV